MLQCERKFESVSSLDNTFLWMKQVCGMWMDVKGRTFLSTQDSLLQKKSNKKSTLRTNERRPSSDKLFHSNDLPAQLSTPPVLLQFEANPSPAALVDTPQQKIANVIHIILYIYLKILYEVYIIIIIKREIDCNLDVGRISFILKQIR